MPEDFNEHKRCGFESYAAGMFDVCKELGITPPDGMSEGDFDYPDEDRGELDMIQYLRGQTQGIIFYLKAVQDNQKRIANEFFYDPINGPGGTSK